MKILIFILAFVSLSMAQEQPTVKEEPKTKLEKFFSKAGSLYIKDFTEEHGLSGNSGTKLIFRALRVYNPGDEKSAIKGLKITLESYKKEGSVFLDLDEIESLERAMDYILAQADKIKAQKNYTEVIFSTKDGFKFGAYNKDSEIVLFASSDKYPYPSFYADFDQLTPLKLIVMEFRKQLQAN
jgi:hypothetical protein